MLISTPLLFSPALSSLPCHTFQLKRGSSLFWQQFPSTEFSPPTWTQIQPYGAAGLLWLHWLMDASETACCLPVLRARLQAGQLEQPWAFQAAEQWLQGSTEAAPHVSRGSASSGLLICCPHPDAEEDTGH